MTKQPFAAAVTWLLLMTTPSMAVSPGEQKFLEMIDRGDDCTVFPLWADDGVPPNDEAPATAENIQNSKSGKPAIRDVDRPSMVVVPPRASVPATGVTILFAPGGGYGSLSLPNAKNLCRWCDSIGAHFVLLKYRVPRDPKDAGHRVPLRDAQRAIRLLRSKSNELRIAPNKLIMAGTSAGGHLAFNVSNNYDEATYESSDPADKLSAKPDATLLLYPAYLTKPITSLEDDPHVHFDRVSPEHTPPIFMAVTRPDKFVSGSIKTMLHLRKSRVPAELHVYPEGGHGGTFDKYPLMEFARPAARFMHEQGLFTKEMQTRSDAWLDDLESSILAESTKPQPPQETRGESASPVAASLASGGLSDQRLTIGDRKLIELHGNRASVFPLWPSGGNRADDPSDSLDESIPDKGDDILRITNVSQPTLHHWPAAKPDGRAVIVFPGGGYNILAAQHEGTEIARWLNSQGITALVAKYRVPRRKGLENHAVALQDAQRAIRLVRTRATELGVDPNQIGVLGFSAGGNLAALTVHSFETPSYEPIDAIDERSAKPNFAILIYPAYLAKDNQDAELDPKIQPLSSREHYPPVFLAVAADDKFAPGSLHYLRHLHQMKTAGELHVYASGGHGKGLRPTGGPFAQWTESCRRWLEDRKNGTENIVIE